MWEFFTFSFCARDGDGGRGFPLWQRIELGAAAGDASICRAGAGCCCCARRAAARRGALGHRAREPAAHRTTAAAARCPARPSSWPAAPPSRLSLAPYCSSPAPRLSGPSVSPPRRLVVPACGAAATCAASVHGCGPAAVQVRPWTLVSGDWWPPGLPLQPAWCVPVSYIEQTSTHHIERVLNADSRHG